MPTEKKPAAKPSPAAARRKKSPVVSRPNRKGPTVAELGERIGTIEATLEDVIDYVAQAKTSPGSSIAGKWAAILGELQNVPRNGHAEVYKNGALQYAYDYVLESDLMAALRPKLAERGLAAFYSDEIVDVRHGERGQVMTTVRVTLTLVDSESGETLELGASDHAIDYGDKAARKAKTGAMRYLLLKGTLNASDEDDGERDEPVEFAPSPETGARDPEPEKKPESGRRRAEPAKKTAKEKLQRRIVELANEFDVIAEQRPGTTLDSIVSDMSGDLPSMTEEWLVFIGKSLAGALDQARVAAADKQEIAPFRIPEDGAPVPFS